MRQDRIIQASIFDLFSEHEIGRELKAMSAWLDAHREVIALVAAELCRPGLKPTGRDGLPAESVLRCALLKQYRQLSYQELAFHLSDSASFRAFARLPLHWCPKKSVLQETISAISARTWERINRCLLASASETKVETGTLLRLDSTVTETMIHEPSDSWLLCDAMADHGAPVGRRRRSAAGCRPLPGIITAGGPSGVPRPSIIAASRPSGRCCIET